MAQCTLHREPALAGADADQDAQCQQGEGADQPQLWPEGFASEGLDGNAAAEQGQRGTDPGQEGAFVGQGIAVVGFAAAVTPQRGFHFFR